MLQNLLSRGHRTARASPNELLFTPFGPAEEHRHREAVEKVIDFLDLQPYREKYIAGLPYGVRKVVEMAARWRWSRPAAARRPASGPSGRDPDVAYWIETSRRRWGSPC